MQRGLCLSVSGCPFQMNPVAVTRSLSNVDTLSLLMHLCYLSLRNNAEATVYGTLQIESSVLSFYFYLFPFHLKCSLVGQRNSIARKVLKRSFFYIFFLYCGQYWSRLPEWDGNCRQFSVSQLAACFICASPAGRPHALLGVGSFPSAACSTL